MNSIIHSNLQLKSKIVIGLISISTFLTSVSVTANGGVPQQIDDINERLEILEQNSNQIIQQVNCTSGDSINAALDTFQNHPAGVVIFFEGVCQENVVIDRNDITLIGSGPGTSSIQPPAVVSGPNVGIMITGADNVVLENLAVSGASTGIVATQSKVAVRNAVVSNSGGGLSIGDNSTAEITNTIVEGNNIGTGLLAFRGGDVIINGSSSIRKFGLGVFASLNATIALTNMAADGITDLGSGPSLVNNRYGANARAGGTLHFLQTSISDDGTTFGTVIGPWGFTRGVYVQAGGTAFFEGGNSIQGTLFGVDATNSSDVIFSVPADNVITNTFFGIRCTGNVGFVVGFPTNSPFGPPPPAPLPAVFSGNNTDNSGCIF